MRATIWSSSATRLRRSNRTRRLHAKIFQFSHHPMHRIASILFILTCVALGETKPTALLPANARVAIIGDSITEQKLYSKFIETYLLACTGRTDIKCFQFGWGGETALAFSNRLENDLGAFKPNVATTCYGM